MNECECLSLNEMNYLYMIESCNNDHMLFENSITADIELAVNESLDIKSAVRKFFGFIAKKIRELIKFFAEMVNRIVEDNQMKALFSETRSYLKNQNLIKKINIYHFNKDYIEEFMKTLDSFHKSIITPNEKISGFLTRTFAGPKGVKNYAESLREYTDISRETKELLDTVKYGYIMSSNSKINNDLNGIGSYMEALNAVKSKVFGTVDKEKEVQHFVDFNEKELIKMESEHKFVSSSLNEIKQKCKSAIVLCDNLEKTRAMWEKKLDTDSQMDLIELLNFHFYNQIQIVNYYRGLCLISLNCLKSQEWNMKKIMAAILGLIIKEN